MDGDSSRETDLLLVDSDYMDTTPSYRPISNPRHDGKLLDRAVSACSTDDELLDIRSDPNFEDSLNRLDVNSHENDFRLQGSKYNIFYIWNYLRVFRYRCTMYRLSDITTVSPMEYLLSETIECLLYKWETRVRFLASGEGNFITNFHCN